MPQYEIREDSGASDTIEADSLESAVEQAKDWSAEGSYDERVMVSVSVHELDPETGERYEDWYYGDGRNAHDEIEAGPEPEPETTECGDSDEDHDWQAPVELVGGLTENPGVFSVGGTRFEFHEVCARCGMYRDSFDQGAQKNPGDLDSGVTYRDADEESLAWTARPMPDIIQIPDAA